MSGSWSDRGGSRAPSGRGGYQAGRVYGRQQEYADPGWERQPAYAEESWEEYDAYDDPGDGGGWAYDDGGYEDPRRRAAARRRAHAEAQARADAEAEAVAAAYNPQSILGRGGRRRQLVLSALLGSAVALLGERLARMLGAGGPANAATTSGTSPQAGTTGAAAGATTPAAGQAGTGAKVLASTTDIPVGGAKIIADQKIVVTQPEQGTFKAFSTVCTHAGCLLDQVKGDKIYCPCHPGVFNLDGTVASGPPPSPLTAKQINVSGNQITL
jgi:Rieske Fe-S protein